MMEGETRYGLSEEIIKQLQSVFVKTPHIKRVDVFGSRARGDYKPSSDIDLAVFGDKDFTFKDFLLLKSRIDDLPIIFKVDMVDFNTLDKQALKDTITRDGQIFWQKGI